MTIRGHNRWRNSPHWSLWGTLEVKGPDGVYLRRVRLFQTPLCGVFVHRLYGPDPDSFMHDHPYDFLSFVLRGWYEELTAETANGPVTRRKIRWVNRKRAKELHRITYVSRRPVWTLVFVGPRFRAWGFQTPSGWIDFDTYRARGLRLV